MNGTRRESLVAMSYLRRIQHGNGLRTGRSRVSAHLPVLQEGNQLERDGYSVPGEGKASADFLVVDVLISVRRERRLPILGRDRDSSRGEFRMAASSVSLNRTGRDPSLQ